ncbi:MAG: spore maturation protein [Myxococcales bacterium]|nr:spore maturation protein [Myxococcales bacterium]
MNGIFLILIAGSVVAAAFAGAMPAVTQAGIDQAKFAVTFAIGLIGQMALWLGFMNVLREAGVMRSIAHRLGPVMRKLFPDIPDDHPALSAMVMNIAANMLGLANAATPFGLKAIRELQRLNPHPGVATNSMALFLAINTSGVAVLPLGVIGVRAALGAERLGSIIVPSLLATMLSTAVAIFVAKSLQGRPMFAPERFIDADASDDAPPTDGGSISGMEEAQQVAEIDAPASPWRMAVLGIFGVAMLAALVRQAGASPDVAGLDQVKSFLESWLLPVLMAVIVLFGFGHRVRVYEAFVKGAKEGFDIGVMIIPYLVAILVGVGMFRASGLLDMLIGGLRPLTDLIGYPAEALPMALIRPLSGSGALGVMTETMNAHGPDSFVGFLVSIMNGSTETTFYVIAVYLGSVHVRAARHTLAACLAADFTGLCAAFLLARLFF